MVKLSGLAVSFVLLIAGAYVWLGPAYISQARPMAVGMGAKLACSSKYVSDFQEILALEDLASYSAALNYLDLTFDDSDQRVRASLLGVHATATFLPGLGCALDYPNHGERDNVEISKTRPSQRRWPAGTVVETILPKAQAALDQALEKDNSTGLQTRALLAVHKGEVIAESYAPGFGPETKLLGWSMAKTVTAIAIGQLIYEGKLSLDDKSLFDEWADDKRADITLRDLLTMTDGLDYNEVYSPGQDATAMLFTEPDSAGYAVKKPLRNIPGEIFNYSSGTANLLAKIIQQKTGGNLQSQVNYLADSLYRPLGLTDFVFEADAAGNLVGSSYVYASARDWARFGWLLLNNGEINGQRLLSPAYIEAATTPNNSENEPAYGFQLWLNRGDSTLRWPALPVDAYAAMGNRAQLIMVIPSQQLVIVRLGWTAGDYPTDARVSQLLKAFGV